MRKIKEITKVLGIDFETANSRRDSACSVGLHLKEFKTDNILSSKEILINPNCDFNYFNVLVHGISPEKVADSPCFPQVYNDITSLIDDDTIVIAHNAPFDVSVLRRSCENLNLEKPKFKFLCTLSLAKAIIKGLPSYSLDYLVNYLNLGNFRHHNAQEDACACIRLFEKLMDICECTTLEQIKSKTGVCYGYMDRYDYKACSKRSCEKHIINAEDVSDNTSVMPIDENHPLYSKIVVFTGTLGSMSRLCASEKVSAVGGCVGKGITKKTNYLVYGFQDKFLLHGKEKSTKLIKEEKYISDGADMQIINEVDFLNMFEE